MSRHTHLEIEKALGIDEIIECDSGYVLTPSIIMPSSLIYALYIASRNASISTETVLHSMQFYPDLTEKFLIGCCCNADIEVVLRIADTIKIDSGALGKSSNIMRAWVARQSINKMLQSNGFLS